MRETVVITGYGQLSPLGDGPELFFAKLMEGARPAKPPSFFEALGTLAGVVAEVDNLDPTYYLGDVNYRPLNRTGLLAVIAAGKALEHARVDEALRVEANTGLVLGTMFCSIGTITAFDLNTLKVGPKYAKPMTFANTVINAAAGQTALWYDLRGPNSTVSCGSISGLAALGYGYDMIAQGRSSMILAGGVEELCFQSFHGFDKQGYLAADASGPAFSAPFDKNSQGFVQGEGAGFLVLESETSALQRGATIYGEIRGHASGFDVSQGRDKDQAVASMVRTIQRALTDANERAEDLDFVYASASGLPSDLLEARALAEILPQPQAVVTSIKGGTGETLGAAGPLNAIAALETIRQQKIPGIAGYQCSVEDFPLKSLSAAGRSLSARRGLIHAQGFDGSCCALVISAGERPA